MPDLTITLAQTHQMYKRTLPSADTQVQTCHTCPMIYDNQRLAGQLVVRLRDGRQLEHTGISVEFVGTIDRHDGTHKDGKFTSVCIQLASAAESPLQEETTLYDFDFGNVRLPHLSYDGLGVSIR